MANPASKITISADGKRAIREFRAIKSAASDLKGSVVGLNTVLAGVGVGVTVTGMFGGATMAAAQFERASADMVKVTSRDRKQIESDILALPSSLGRASSLMSGYYQTISAGIKDPASAMDTLKVASEAATSAGVSQSDEIKALTKVMAGYGDSLKDARDASDLLFAIEAEGQTSVGELVPVVGDLATVSNEANVKVEEFGAAMAVLTQTSGSTSEAATKYKSILMSLIKPTDNMTKALTALHYESGKEFIQDKGFAGALSTLQALADKNKFQMSELFDSSESIIGISRLIDSADVYAASLDNIKNRAGATARAHEAVTNTIEHQWDTLVAAAEKAGIVFASGFSEPIKGGLSDVSTAIDENVESVKAYGKQVGSTVAELVSDLKNLTIAAKENIDVVEHVGVAISGLLIARTVGPAIGVVATALGNLALQGMDVETALAPVLAMLGGPAGAMLLGLGGGLYAANAVLSSWDKKRESGIDAGVAAASNGVAPGLVASQKQLDWIDGQIAKKKATLATLDDPSDEGIMDGGPFGGDFFHGDADAYSQMQFDITALEKKRAQVQAEYDKIQQNTVVRESVGNVWREKIAPLPEEPSQAVAGKDGVALPTVSLDSTKKGGKSAERAASQAAAEVAQAATGLDDLRFELQQLKAEAAGDWFGSQNLEIERDTEKQLAQIDAQIARTKSGPAAEYLAQQKEVVLAIQDQKLAMAETEQYIERVGSMADHAMAMAQATGKGIYDAQRLAAWADMEERVTRAGQDQATITRAVAEYEAQIAAINQDQAQYLASRRREYAAMVGDVRAVYDAEIALAQIEKERADDPASLAAAQYEIDHATARRDLDVGALISMGGAQSAYDAHEQLADSIENLIPSAFDVAGNSASQFFEDLISGSMSAEDALLNFANNAVAELATLITQLGLACIKMALLGSLSSSTGQPGGSSGGSAWGFAGTLVSAIGSIFGFSVGGEVPGVGNSDSVAAMLTPGEYVIPKAAAQKLGTSALDMMRQGKTPAISTPVRHSSASVASGLAQQSSRSSAQSQAANESKRSINQAFFFDRREMAQYVLNSPEFRDATLHTIGQHARSVRNYLAD